MHEFKTIVLPIDFSRYCEGAAAYASWIASRSGATIHVVHVIVNPADEMYEPGEVAHWVLVEHAESRARDLMIEAVDRCIPPGITVERHIAHGDPYGKIAAVADTIGADLIVMSSHGRGGLANLVMGSVAEKLVRHATCPVLVVPRKS